MRKKLSEKKNQISKVNTKYNVLQLQSLQYRKRGFPNVLWKTLTFINHFFIAQGQRKAVIFYIPILLMSFEIKGSLITFSNKNFKT